MLMGLLVRIGNLNPVVNTNATSKEWTQKSPCFRHASRDLGRSLERCHGREAEISLDNGRLCCGLPNHQQYFRTGWRSCSSHFPWDTRGIPHRHDWTQSPKPVAASFCCCQNQRNRGRGSSSTRLLF